MFRFNKHLKIKSIENNQYQTSCFYIYILNCLNSSQETTNIFIIILSVDIIIQTLLSGFHLYTSKDLEIKETTETASSASLFDIYLKSDTNGDFSTTSVFPLYIFHTLIVIYEPMPGMGTAVFTYRFGRLKPRSSISRCLR